MKLPDADDDGNDLPPLVAGSDAATLVYLLEYARKRGFSLGPTIQVGAITVQVRDLRLSEGAGRPETDIFTEHGYQGDK